MAKRVGLCRGERSPRRRGAIGERSATGSVRMPKLPAGEPRKSEGRMWLVVAGWLASALVFTTFFMRTMIPLRLVAIASNVAFMAYAVLGLRYGVFGRLYPILVLHASLLPLNVLRLRQLRELVQAVRTASD